MDEAGNWTREAGSVVVCKRCGGDGLDHLKAADVQTMMEVGPMVWEALLAGQYGKLYGRLREWHEQARGILARRVR